jgi:hypothetical protein
MTDPPYTPGPPARNGHAHGGGSEPTGARRCPGCGVTGVRYLRSTGRWWRDATGNATFAYITFCAACGHEYPIGNV